VKPPKKKVKPEIVVAVRPPPVLPDLPELPDLEVLAVREQPPRPVELPELDDLESTVESKPPVKMEDLPELEDEVRTEQHFFDGKWLPDLDGAEVGVENFTAMENFKYSDDGPVGVSGYTKRTSTTSPFA